MTTNSSPFTFSSSSHLFPPSLPPFHDSIHLHPFSPLLKLLVFISPPSFPHSFFFVCVSSPTPVFFFPLFSFHPSLPLSSVSSSCPPRLSIHQYFSSGSDSIVALLLRRADSLSVLAVGFKHTKSTPERNRYFATEISPFPGEYSLK